MVGSGVDGERWLSESSLPPTHDWRLIDPADVPRRAMLLVWLWNPDEQRRDLPRLYRCIGRLIRVRGNRLVPTVFVAAPGGTLADGWMVELQQHLRRFYQRRLNG